MVWTIDDLTTLASSNICRADRTTSVVYFLPNVLVQPLTRQLSTCGTGVLKIDQATRSAAVVLKSFTVLQALRRKL